MLPARLWRLPDSDRVKQFCSCFLVCVCVRACMHDEILHVSARGTCLYVCVRFARLCLFCAGLEYVGVFNWWIWAHGLDGVWVGGGHLFVFISPALTWDRTVTVAMLCWSDDIGGFSEGLSNRCKHVCTCRRTDPNQRWRTDVCFARQPASLHAQQLPQACTQVEWQYLVTDPSRSMVVEKPRGKERTLQALRRL